MHRFSYKNGSLWCEEVPVAQVAEALGTPLYLYSYRTILDHYRKLAAAFSPVKALICFAVKANSSLSVLRALVKAGAGFDVVSGGELEKVLRVGANPKRIVYASVGKTEAEIRAALKAGILFFNVESAQELEQIERVAKRLKRRQRVSLRLNPEVDPDTHPFIATGHKTSKFGMDLKTVQALLSRARSFPHLLLEGLHIHIGSQILKAGPFKEAVVKALQLVDWAWTQGIPIRYLNIGGGLGIVYHRENPQTAAQYARAIIRPLKRARVKVILEPGRFIVGNSGILLTRVLYLKQSRSKRFAVVDAGMNDLIRPSLYGAYHEIVPAAQNRRRQGRRVRYDVVGPVCESGDFFAKDRPLPPLNPGDLLAILGAGAYGFTMASNYNSRPRPAEALVYGRRWEIIRRRERYQDLIRGERIPSFLRGDDP